MNLKFALLLLCNFYCVCSGEGVSTTEKYPPCDNKITLAYDTTLALDEAAYKKQIDFLINYVFEEWNNFNGLALFSYGHYLFKKGFKAKADVEDYILNNKRVDKHVDVCFVFTKLYLDEHDIDFTSLIIFLREFNNNYIDWDCMSIINDLDSDSNSILFVPLSKAVNVGDLKEYFSKATILVWDIENKDVPDNWKEQFDKNFGCDISQTTTSYDLTTTNLPNKYPCNQEYMFVIETSTRLETFVFQRQLNFLANYTFEQWNNFGHLQFLQTGNLETRPIFSRYELNEYVKNIKQIESNNTACSVFYKFNIETNTRIVLFLNGFDSSDIIDDCNSDLRKLILAGNSFAFVPLSDEFNVTMLKHYYNQVNIIEWNITNNEAPDDWEEQFNDFYDCKDYKTTTSGYSIGTTTESSINSYPPCDSTVIIAFDKSVGLSEYEYQLEKDFLTNHVFQNWTQFNKLNLISFADHVYSNVVQFKDANELAEFVESEQQIDNFEKELTMWTTCQEIIDDNLNVQVTIVVLNNALNTDTLRQHIPQAQFIKLNLSEVPENWEWQFLTAYGCNKDDYNDQTKYPCNSKFIFAYEVSSELDKNALNGQRGFLLNIFNEHWSVFNNLELIAYSNETQTKDFGTLKNLNDIHSFIESTTKQNNAFRISLCKLFKDLKTMHLLNVNIILFVSNFHEKDRNDECTFWIKQVRENSNFINFVSLANQVNVEYLLEHIPQATFTSWNPMANKMPDNWNVESYGCQNFIVPEEPLICETLNKVAPSKIFPSNLLFFVSKFDETVFASSSGDCGVDAINGHTNNITFIALTQLVNKTFLLNVFRNATVIYWNVKEEEFPNWNQVLWGSFGCHGESPIILPPPITTSTSTYMPTTPSLTSTSQITSTKTSSTKHSTDTTTPTTITSTTQTTTTQSPPPNTPSPLIIVVSVLAPLFLISLCLFAAFVYFCRLRNRSQLVNNMVFNASNRNEYDVTKREEEEIDLWEIETSNIEVFTNRQLGSGASASVYLGKLTGDSGIKRVYPDVIALRQFSNCEVAVKVLPFFATELNKEDFKQELIFMKGLKYHSNIICLLGYTSEKIVLEYCANGDLMHFLKKNKEQFNTDREDSLKLKDLFGFAWQVANGMDYFSSLNLVHRDLAARNILLTKENICKISDFGLAREGDVQSYTSRRRMPVRWLPPEALKSFEYSTKTDVWSYAVLLFEVFTIGEFPYSELENTEILSFIDSGNRLEKPEHASDEIYELMLSCWNSVVEERPTFTDICQKLIPLLEQFNIDYNYVDPTEAETNDIFEIESEEIEI